jgi:hypothetical protein
MNVKSFITKDYRKKGDFAVRKNKPNSNPISEKPKMNVNLYVIKEYENETAFRLPKKQTQTNPTCSELVEPISNPAFDLHLYPRFLCGQHRCGQACGRILVQSGIDLLEYVSRQTAKQ